MKTLTYILLLGVFLLPACKTAYYDHKGQWIYRHYDCNDTTYCFQQHFFPNGKIQSEGYLRNGKGNGKFKEWNIKGIQIAEWIMIDDKYTGLVQCWYDNGEKKKECPLDKGVQNGHFKEWYKNGKLEKEGDYENDKKEGYWTYWNKNGKLTEIRYYERDSLIFKIE